MAMLKCLIFLLLPYLHQLDIKVIEFIDLRILMQFFFLFTMHFFMALFVSLFYLLAIIIRICFILKI